MASSIFRNLGLLSNIQKCTTKMNLVTLTENRLFHSASVDYARRKGTREKAKKAKVKVEIKKVGFIPHNQRGKDKFRLLKINKHLNDSYKSTSTDNVWPMRYYQWPLYTAEEAVKCHQETHHPTMYNEPDAFIIARIELNMQAAKKNRFVENFTRIAVIPNAFPRDEQRTILAFCKGPELQKEALDAGATLAGGVETIRAIQEGNVSVHDFDYVIAHPNIITEMVPIRGLMKRKFPNPRSGTLDPDLPGLVNKFSSGVLYKVVKDEHQNDFGSFDAIIGRVNMKPNKVAENIAAIIKDVDSNRPKRDGLFVTRCYILSPPSSEKLKIDPFVFIKSGVISDDSKSAEEAGSDAENEDSDDEKPEAVKV